MEFLIILVSLIVLVGLLVAAYESYKGHLTWKRLSGEGVDLDRYIPTFRYIHGAPRVPASFSADHSMILNGKDDFIFCSVERELFDGDHPKEKFWKLIKRDFCRLPKRDVRMVIPYIRPTEDVEADKTPLTDILVNQTVGRLFGVSTKTVPYAAFIIIVTKSNPEEIILFGIPDGPTGAKTEFGFLGMVLPETASTYLEYGSMAMDLLGIELTDSPAAGNAKRAARQIIADLEKYHATIRPGSLPPPLPSIRTDERDRSGIAAPSELS